MTLEDKIKILKARFGVSLSLICQQAKVDRTTVQKWLAGERSLTEDNKAKLESYIMETLKLFR